MRYMDNLGNVTWIKRGTRGLIACFSFLLLSCTTMDLKVSNRVSIPASSEIAIGPIANYSDTPLANKQVESVLLGLMHGKGFLNAQQFPNKQACKKLLYCPEEAQSKDTIIKWARSHGVRYVLTGSTNEWRYKVGLDGEPVAGVSLQLIDSQSRQTIWTGVGSVIGGSRLGLDVVGQKLLSQTLTTIIAIN